MHKYWPTMQICVVMGGTHMICVMLSFVYLKILYDPRVFWKHICCLFLKILSSLTNFLARSKIIKRVYIGLAKRKYWNGATLQIITLAFSSNLEKPYLKSCNTHNHNSNGCLFWLSKKSEFLFWVHATWYLRISENINLCQLSKLCPWVTFSAQNLATITTFDYQTWTYRASHKWQAVRCLR